MAKFCTKCGKETVDGVCPDCSKTNEVKEEVKEEIKTASTTTTSNSNDMINGVINYLKRLVQKPVDVTKESIEKNDTKMALILSSISCAMYGLFAYVLSSTIVKQMVDSVNSQVGEISSGLSSALGGSMGGLATSSLLAEMKIPFFKTLLSVAVVMIVAYVVLALMGKLFIGVIGKTKVSMNELFNINGTTSIVSTVLMVVATILAFFLPKIAVYVMGGASVAYFVLLIQHYLDILKADNNKAWYTVPLMIISSIALVIFIMLVVAGMLVDSAASSSLLY